MKNKLKEEAEVKAYISLRIWKFAQWHSGTYCIHCYSDTYYVRCHSDTHCVRCHSVRQYSQCHSDTYVVFSVIVSYNVFSVIVSYSVFSVIQCVQCHSDTHYICVSVKKCSVSCVSQYILKVYRHFLLSISNYLMFNRY